MTDSSLKVIAETFLIGGGYILTSACLLNFNKYLMNGRFPYAKVFTTFHMIMATLLSLLLYKFAPSLYPSMDKARANWKAVLKFMVPLGCLFAMNLYLSNKALQYCTVICAVLQRRECGTDVRIGLLNRAASLHLVQGTPKTSVRSQVACNF